MLHILCLISSNILQDHCMCRRLAKCRSREPYHVRMAVAGLKLWVRASFSAVRSYGVHTFAMWSTWPRRSARRFLRVTVSGTGTTWDLALVELYGPLKSSSLRCCHRCTSSVSSSQWIAGAEASVAVSGLNRVDDGVTASIQPCMSLLIWSV